MKQLTYFLMVGLSFIALQVVSVEAQVPTSPPIGGWGNETVPPLMLGDVGGMPPVAPPEEDHRRLPKPEDMGKFFKYDQEYRSKGVISQKSYDELSKAGYTKKRVDWILMTDHGKPSAR